MNAALISISAAVISGLFALATLFLTRRQALKDRLAVALEVALDFRMPLLAAASDLQARLYNIRKQDFLTRFADGISTRSRPDYAVENTLYLIGQYLCYAEIIRRGLLFLDPSDRHRQHALVEQIEQVRNIFSDSKIAEPTLCLFRGEQRAVGEVMLIETNAAPGHSRRWDCVGYATFVGLLDQEEVAQWFQHLREDIAILQKDLEGHDGRLVLLQHALIDLVLLIDPGGEHVSTNLREKL
ncbi:MAG: hypothetical protein ACLPVF_14240 [Acidimicrobiales bacterium]